MYLAMLNEDQKSMFLSLALYLAKIDNDYSVQEQEIIQSYCDEMNIKTNQFVEFKSVNQLISMLDESCDMITKRIIVFEAIGLALIDQDYSDEEKKIIHLMSSYFGIEQGYLEECEQLIREYVVFQTKFNSLVLKDNET